MFLEQQNSLISEGSCDTEDWSNDAENSALNHRNRLHFNIYSLNCNNISQYYCTCDQINVSRHLSKTIKKCNYSKLLPSSVYWYIPSASASGLCLAHNCKEERSQKCHFTQFLELSVLPKAAIALDTESVRTLEQTAKSSPSGVPTGIWRSNPPTSADLCCPGHWRQNRFSQITKFSLHSAANFMSCFLFSACFDLQSKPAVFIEAEEEKELLLFCLLLLLLCSKLLLQ